MGGDSKPPISLRADPGYAPLPPCFFVLGNAPKSRGCRSWLYKYIAPWKLLADDAEAGISGSQLKALIQLRAGIRAKKRLALLV